MQSVAVKNGEKKVFSLHVGVWGKAIFMGPQPDSITLITEEPSENFKMCFHNH